MVLLTYVCITLHQYGMAIEPELVYVSLETTWGHQFDLDVWS